MKLTIESGGQWPEDAERLLGELPEWFGIPEANATYVESARVLPSYAAYFDADVVGICTIRHHNPESAEIDLLAVARAHHRVGVGRALVARVEQDLRADGVRMLQVKTLGPSDDYEPYVRTRFFYASAGFVPLEERTDIWGADNPCLIFVKAL